MKYYLELSEELVEHGANLHNDTYKLGEESFGTFYAGQGFHLFEDLVDKDELEHISIVASDGTSLGVEEFVDQLEEWTVLVQ